VGHLEQHLVDRVFLLGDALTGADFGVIAMTIYFRRFGFPFERYPKFTAWYQRMHGLPAWRAVNVDPWVP
jgi:glutathione S-transferase